MIDKTIEKLLINTEQGCIIREERKERRKPKECKMTRQEQIEEIAKIVDEMYNVYTTTADDIAEGLYNVGYRKAEEVRKETAKEILSRIKLYATGSKTDLIVLIDEIAKANGVEVEE